MRAVELRHMTYAAMLGAATAAGAYIIIPLPPVPVTLQTFFLYLAAALLGGRLAALSQVVYLLIGIIGLPVFAGGKGGLGVLFGPTGGYLIGFVAAAYLTGKLIQWQKTPGLPGLAVAMALGTAVIYLLGAAQLTLVAHLTWGRALAVGVLPFLVGDAVKIGVAAFVAQRVRRHRLGGESDDSH